MVPVKCSTLNFLLAGLSFSSAVKVSYDGFQVLRLSAGYNVEVVEAIISSFNLSTWKNTEHFADVLVPPQQLKIFNEEVTGLNATVIDQDVGVSIASETISELGASSQANSPPVNDTWFASYHLFAEHLRWLKTIQSQFNNSSEMMFLPRSAEGNAISGIHIFSGNPGNKPAVVFHGTVHAREWITTMVVEYIAYALLVNSSSDTQIRGLLEKFDFYLLPIVNPDGFIFSQTQDRMWRKNRELNKGSRCIGVDLNRNWPYKWDTPGGSDSNMCNEAYRGSGPGASPKIKALMNSLKEIDGKHGIKLYIDFHSYSQVFLSPYGYTCSEFPSNHRQLQALMKGAVSRVGEQYGTKFTYGPICSTMYLASGTSVDYVHETFPGATSLAVELRGKGFVVPANEILASGEEMFQGIKYILKHLE